MRVRVCVCMRVSLCVCLRVRACVCVACCPSRGGALPAMSPVGEDPAASHQAPQRGPGAQVQPQGQALPPALPLPEEQARRLLCPHPAGSMLARLAIA